MLKQFLLNISVSLLLLFFCRESTLAQNLGIGLHTRYLEMRDKDYYWGEQ